MVINSDYNRRFFCRRPPPPQISVTWCSCQSSFLLMHFLKVVSVATCDTALPVFTRIWIRSAAVNIGPTWDLLVLRFLVITCLRICDAFQVRFPSASPSRGSDPTPSTAKVSHWARAPVEFSVLVYIRLTFARAIKRDIFGWSEVGSVLGSAHPDIEAYCKWGLTRTLKKIAKSLVLAAS